MMSRRIILLSICLASLLTVGGAPATSQPEALLKVTGQVSHPLSLSAPALAALPHVTLVTKDRDGKEIRYTGVPIRAILDQAGVPSTKQMRNGAIALALVVEAADGYQAVFSLTEIDAQPADRPVLLADQRDGKPLAPPESPVRLIALQDQRPTRWVRQVTTLRIAKP
jgi:DMSO/TMAO reductase YedYZ molybdopterin-dependent catalytic subunit